MIVFVLIIVFIFMGCVSSVSHYAPPCDNAEARLCFDNAEKSGLAQAGDGPTASSLGIRLGMIMIR